MSTSPDPMPILIAGPTASGKSALAIRVAEATGGVIINADAMQVYRELPLLTARPSPEDEARVPHRLYGHVAAGDAYSVGRYVSDVVGCLADARARGLRPILVGGTGLYFKALLEGLSPIPPVAPGVRDHWRQQALQHGAGALHAILKARDPVMAQRLSTGDTQRLTRALEVLESTGLSLAHWQGKRGTPLLAPQPAARLVLRPETPNDRAALLARCDTRFDQMMAAGALDEVRALLAMGLDPALPSMGALGVRSLAMHLGGDSTLGAAIDRAKLETRHYVKRQLTWLKRNMIAWRTVKTDDLERNDRSIKRFIDHSAANA